MPKVSILMSTYNDGPELIDSIRSLFCQSFKDFEIILIDDCSNDKTRSILRELSIEDPRLHVSFNSQNLGFSACLNIGIRLCNGQYIARMDGDDISLPNRISTEVAFLDSRPEFAFCGSSYFLFDENGVWGFSKMKSTVTKKDVFYGSSFCHPSVMIRKDALLAVGSYTVFSRKTRMAEDYDLWCKFYYHGFLGANISLPLLKYRENLGSYKKRKFKYQLNYLKLKRKWRRLFRYSPFVNLSLTKDLLVGLLPRSIYYNLHRRTYIKQLSKLDGYQKGSDNYGSN